MDSKSLPPRTESFFPTIFYKTQFCERQAGLPDGLDLSSQVAIITGGNAGLGYESARQLLALNVSHLILAVRSEDKGEQAATRLRQLSPKAKIEVWKLDMCSYTSIQAFAKRVEADLTRLDIALLNAGLVKPQFDIVKETGHEETLQVVSLMSFRCTAFGQPLIPDRTTCPQCFLACFYSRSSKANVQLASAPAD